MSPLAAGLLQGSLWTLLIHFGFITGTNEAACGRESRVRTPAGECLSLFHYDRATNGNIDAVFASTKAASLDEGLSSLSKPGRMRSVTCLLAGLHVAEQLSPPWRKRRNFSIGRISPARRVVIGIPTRDLIANQHTYWGRCLVPESSMRPFELQRYY
jgi:hypothetical protein